MASLIKYWKPLAVLILLMMVWLHGDHNGAERVDSRWQLVSAKAASKAARNALAAERKARKQEQEWVAAFDLSATLHQETLRDSNARRDRIIAGLRAGRLRLSTCPGLPEAAAHPGEPEAAETGGQSGVVGEAITGRLAVCDEVTLERNQAVRLLEAERR